MSSAAREPAKSGAKSGPRAGAKRAAAGRKGAHERPRRRRSGWKPTAGEQLRKALDPSAGPKGIELLVEQAARCADRLEVLDRLHRGDVDSWVRLEVARVVADHAGPRERKAFYVDCTLKIDATIAEEARQAKLLSSLLSDIYRQRPSSPSPPANPRRGGIGGDTANLDSDD